MSNDDARLHYASRLGDNALILAQRMTELVAALPDLEEELANANFALDYLGQARLFYSYAAEVENAGRDEDDFAFLRDERDFRNLLLLEQPNGHFGDGIVRAVLFETFYLLQLDALCRCGDARIAEIAARAQKEVRYHLRHNRNWLLRLGDGTGESHEKMQVSVDSLWQYTGEMFAADAIDRAFAKAFDGPDLAALEGSWRRDIVATLEEATLRVPDDGWMASGGKAGRHSEAFGFLLAEMQSLKRAHPEAEW